MNNNPNPFPNLSAGTTNKQPARTNVAHMTEQFQRLKQQQEAVEARQRELDALRAKHNEAQRPPVQAIPGPSSGHGGEKEKEVPEQPDQDLNESMDSVDEWANQLEAEETNTITTVALHSSATPAMDQVAQAVEVHRRQHVQKEGGDVETIKLTIPDGAHKVQPLGPAPQLKIKDLMPKGQASQTGKLNPEMVANMPNKTNCAEFFIIQQIIGTTGMSIPDKNTFDGIMDAVALKLLEINDNWVNTIEWAEVGRNGIGVVVLNYGNTKAADTVRDLIVRQSTDEASYQTYPVGDLMKRYAVTAFIHAGLNFLPSIKIGPLLKKCNPDIRGTFTIIDCRTLSDAGKEGCRVISIEGSPAFMAYLATTSKQHQFRILHKKVYLNGGKRSDSVSDYTAPTLTHSASIQLIKGVNDLIMTSATKRYQSQRAFPERRCKISIYIINLCVQANCYLFLQTGLTKDQPMDGHMRSPNVALCRCGTNNGLDEQWNNGMNGQLDVVESRLMYQVEEGRKRGNTKKFAKTFNRRQCKNFLLLTLSLIHI